MQVINPAVQAIFQKAAQEVKDAIKNRPDLSYQEIANENAVSIAFVNSCAKALRQETGFARLPAKVKS